MVLLFACVWAILLFALEFDLRGLGCVGFLLFWFAAVWVWCDFVLWCCGCLLSVVICVASRLLFLVWCNGYVT